MFIYKLPLFIFLTKILLNHSINLWAAPTIKFFFGCCGGCVGLTDGSSGFVGSSALTGSSGLTGSDGSSGCDGSSCAHFSFASSKNSMLKNENHIQIKLQTNVKRNFFSLTKLLLTMLVWHFLLLVSLLLQLEEL